MSCWGANDDARLGSGVDRLTLDESAHPLVVCTTSSGGACPGFAGATGVSIGEAMACGIPTVGSKLDGSRDALRNGQLGILADPTDAEDVQRAVFHALARKRGEIPEGLDYFSSIICRAHEVNIAYCFSETA